MDGHWPTTAGAHHFFANHWVASDTGQSIDVVDPSDGAAFARIARGNATDIDRPVVAARRALGDAFDGDWGRFTATERGRLLMKLSVAVLDHQDELGRIESESRSETAFHLQDRIDYSNLLNLFSLQIAGRINYRTIDRHTRYQSTSIQSPSIFDTQVDELGIAVESGLL